MWKIGMNIRPTHREISACFVEVTYNFNNKELFYSPLQMAPIVRATNWSVKSICLSNFYNRCLYVVVFPFTPKSVITTKAREKKRASEIIQRNIHASAN